MPKRHPEEGERWEVTHPAGHGDGPLGLIPGQEVEVVGVYDPGTAGVGWQDTDDSVEDDAEPHVLINTVGWNDMVVVEDEDGNPQTQRGEVTRSMSVPLSVFHDKFEPKED